ncbi:MAG: ZIP family metal transporter [Nanoarchaeota archaeon]
MLPTLANILLSVLIVSVISFIGALTLLSKFIKFDKMMFWFVSFAAGAMLSAAFFDLLPEAVEAGGDLPIFAYVFLGMALFFLVEKLLYWHHCHHGSCHSHHGHMHKGMKPVGLLNLIGDGVHNFLDGAIIASSYLVNPQLGVVTTIAVILHEIPQEIGDFSILIYAGFSKGKALFFNFLSALTAILGAVVAYFFAGAVETAEPVMLAMAAGGFIYIAAADLIPELHHDQDYPKALIQLVWFALGAFIIYLVSTFFVA